MTWRSVGWAAAGWLAVVAAGAAARAADNLDWDAWERMPVFDGGRMMPLDTFARKAAEKICGRESPRLGLAGAAAVEDIEGPAYAGARKIFPDGQARKFRPGELLLSWLVESERWERVPFLVAKQHDLREKVLGLPLTDQEGRPLEHVSPYQFDNSRALRKWRMEVGRKMREAREAGREPELDAADKKGIELVQAYDRWRQLVFQPQSLAHGPTEFAEKLAAANGTWQSVREAIGQFRDMDRQQGPGESIDGVSESLDGLVKLGRAGRLPLAEVEPLVARLRTSSEAMALWFDEHNARFAKALPEMDPQRQKEALAYVNTLASRGRDLARHAAELQTALFDNGGTLKLVPNLNPFALEENRTPEENPQPWLSLQALLLGSRDTLRGYPPAAVDEVRSAFRQTAAAYLARDREDRPAEFTSGMERFASSVRVLGEKINPIRAKLPVKQMDTVSLAATRYPPAGATGAEVHYNRFQPFLWSWIASMVGVVLFSLSFGAIRKPMFWAGLAAMVGAGLFISYGFGLRTYITGWAPVTNMFETVVFVALVVAGLGLWFTLVPLFWPGIKLAWRLTAAPATWEARPGRDGDGAILSRETQATANWLMLAPRVGLMFVAFFALTQVPYGEGQGYTVVSLMPRVETGGGLTSNDFVAWGVGLVLLAFSMWYVPRVALTGLLSLGTIPYTLARAGVSEPLAEVIDRKVFTFSGAAVSLVASLLAYWAPVFDASIEPLRPVLRDNFWLTIHVLTITASYGAGALALGLGNVALFHYLFGRYRNPPAPSPQTLARGHRPAGNLLMFREIHRREPAAATTLAAYTYRATQVAVVLLAAGTLLGALWADVAWGRFWGWDAKEVWALISLLVYLVILHGRYAGLFGNFGLAAFSVVGATSIMMAWYGVNFVLGTGMHSYGRGAGGLWAVATFVALDWIFMAVAAIRYNVEVRQEAQSPFATPDYAASDSGDLARLDEEVAAR